MANTMTKDQVLAAVKKYEGLLKDYPVEKIDTRTRRPTREQALKHLRWMFVEVAVHIAGVEGKSDRWIGFIQGVLWLAGFGSIEDFKNDNR